jgi:DNA-binding CsgD family transcriptional regulator/PAS domain-containing protein
MASSDGPSLAAFSRVVEAIYDCTLDPARWPAALQLIAEFTGSGGAGMGIVDHGQQRNIQLYEYGYPAEDVKTYFLKYAALNPLFVARRLFPVGQAVTAEMLISEEELLQSRFYVEYAQPRKLRHLMTIELLRTGHRSAGISGVRYEHQPPYAAKDIELFQLLSPHLCRACAIADALDLRTITSQVLETTLDNLAAGVYLTDREGRVVYMNSAAERQTRTSNAVQILNNRLSARSRDVSMSLSKAIADAARDETASDSGSHAVALPDGDGAGLVATVLPLDRGMRRTVSTPFAACAAVFIQDPNVAPPLPGEAFAKLYNLTGGELRVLLALAPGLNVKEAADMIGISASTAKTHLQHIFEKTGTSKQTELLQLLMSSSPPVRAG